VKFGLGEIDLVLLGAGAVGLLVAVVTLAAVVVCAIDISRQLNASPGGKALRTDADVLLHTGFELRVRRWLPFVHLDWRWLSPDATCTVARRAHVFAERVRFARRGEVTRVVRAFEISDIFGLFRIRLERAEDRRVRIEPSVGRIDAFKLIPAFASGSDISHPKGAAVGDRIDLRPYSPGDPVRLVVWKVYARSRELVIRTPERAVSPVRRTVAYLVTSASDEAAAAAARTAIESGSLGQDWVLGVDGRAGSVKSTVEAAQVLIQSGNNAENVGGTGLGGFLQGAAAGSVSRAVVFVPPRPGPWLERTAAAAAAAECATDFVVCADGLDDALTDMPRLRRLFRRESRELASRQSRPARAELATVVRRLQAARAGVTVIDRLTGRPIALHRIVAKEARP
jgi:hypothetical protein